jgi:hypothetical protein
VRALGQAAKKTYQLDLFLMKTNGRLRDDARYQSFLNRLDFDGFVDRLESVLSALLGATLDYWSDV